MTGDETASERTHADRATDAPSDDDGSDATTGGTGSDATGGGDATGRGDAAGEGDAAVDAVVRCVDVTHEYGRRGESRLLGLGRRGSRSGVTALRDVSLRVDRGEVVGLAGPSGSGKSTLLHAVAGLVTPTSGTVTLDGVDLTSLSDRERTRLRHRSVGIVFQRFHLLPSLSARANVALPLVQSGVPRRARRERAEVLLAAVGLADRAGHAPGELSGGEQQRVAVARAVATDPTVVIADEPTGELDADASATVLDVLADVAADRAVVVASHDEAALAVADRVVRLRDGRVVDDDP